MFIKKDTHFENGHILTKEMLNLVYTWPRQLLGLYSQQLADGILCGLDYLVKDDDLIIRPGVLWYHGDFWFLEKDFSVNTFLASQETTGSRQALHLAAAPAKEKGEVSHSSLRCTLGENTGGPDLGSFSLYHKMPKNWDELITSLDNARYFHLENIPWAAPRESTFHRLIFTYLAEKLANKKERTALENLLLAQIYEKGSLSLATLRLYTGDSEETSRADLLRHIDQQLKSERRTEQQPQPAQPQPTTRRLYREKPGRI